MEVVVASKNGNGVTVYEPALSLKDADDMYKFYNRNGNDGRQYKILVTCTEEEAKQLPTIFTKIKTKNDKVMYELAV